MPRVHARGWVGAVCAGVLMLAGTCLAGAAEIEERAQQALARMGVRAGVCAVLGLPDAREPGFVADLARGSEMLVYFQSPDAGQVDAVRRAAYGAGLLGTRVFADVGGWEHVHLADNLATIVWAAPTAKGVARSEIVRLLHPGGRAVLDPKSSPQPIVKPAPQGTDTWSHPYHGPDNNPLSTDQVARYPYLTQFMGYPLFGCISEVTVAAGGRVYKAFGHIAFKTAQNEVLNRLYGINAYNGAILWSRALRKGFMIHRNTMVATADALYLADDQSCKVIEGATGKVLDEIVPPAEQAEGTVWKWMAMKDGVLYALLGGPEVQADLRRATTRGFGHWPWGMWKGYDYKAGARTYGFGRNLFAIDAKTKRVIWHHREDELLDSRGVCLRDGRIYGYAPGKHLVCLSASNGKEAWRTSAADVLGAIGAHTRAQHYTHGFSSSVYMKCNGTYLLFAGPQRPNLAAVRCADGSLAWSHKDGNCQLVLRPDALYAVGHGPGQTSKSGKYDYATGKLVGQFMGRRACTRATGTVDSIFYRAAGGTIRYDPATNAAEHIAPMRPPCHDGVVIADGVLSFGPWVCGCHLSLYGNIGLASAGRFDFARKVDEAEQLEAGQGDISQVAPLPGSPATRGKTTTCGEMAFSVGPDGAVRATSGGKAAWTAWTGAGINSAPAVWQGRVFVGSNDGRVYAFEGKTGRLLWRFRAAPAERWIPVYGKLMSTWPVAGGVAVANGMVYAAAGIAHYDGTHVYALDGVTGKVKWHNGTSGTLGGSKNGISLQGPLSISGARLLFCGGNAYPNASYSLATGRCLVAPHGPKGQRPTTFYAVDEYMRKVDERERQEAAKRFSGKLKEIRSGTFFAVDLRPHCNHPLAAKPVAGQPRNDLHALPVGKQTLRGVAFDIVEQAKNGGKSMIRLLSSRHAKGLPREVKGIAVGGRKASRLYFLHFLEFGTAYRRRPETGLYRIHYEGRDQAVEIPLVNGRNIEEWWEPRETPQVYVGWHGNSGSAHVGVYIHVWQNPHPEAPIASIDVVTRDVGPSISLIGITCEE